MLFKEKLLPQLSQVKNFRNNTTSVVTDEAKKKFKELWNKTTVDTSEDDIRRGNILKIVEPMMTTDPTKAVVDVPEVKILIGETRICWGCLSLVCRTRQLLLQKKWGRS